MDHKTLVLKALEDSRWDWRTVDGVSRDTGLSPAEVIEILESSTDEVIRSRIGDRQGRTLYTTRRHYSATQSFLDKFRST